MGIKSYTCLMKRRCYKCRIQKDLSLFYKGHYACKTCHKKISSGIRAKKRLMKKTEKHLSWIDRVDKTKNIEILICELHAFNHLNNIEIANLLSIKAWVVYKTLLKYYQKPTENLTLKSKV